MTVPGDFVFEEPRHLETISGKKRYLSIVACVELRQSLTQNRRKYGTLFFHGFYFHFRCVPEP